MQDELTQLIAQKKLPGRLLVIESMLHMDPPALGKILEERLQDIGQVIGASDKVFAVPPSLTVLVFGECAPYMKELTEQPNVVRPRHINCVSLVLGKQRYREMRKQGAFFLLPEWTLRWRDVFITHLGLDRETAQLIVSESHSELVYLDTGCQEPPLEILQEIGKYMNMPWHIEYVGLDILLEELEGVLDEYYKRQ